MTGAATDAAIESEVAELHRFFEQWFAGDDGPNGVRWLRLHETWLET